MRAVDTNVLVRLIVRDDAGQVEAAEEFVSGGAWVSHVVLAEAAWVLDSVYELDATQIAAAVEALLENPSVSLQQPELVRDALGRFRAHAKAGFADCLILESARRAGHLPLGTFDRTLGKLPGAERL
jgi:predicted nucleic-acid-binding protein